MISEEPLQKFHTDGMPLPKLVSTCDWLKQISLATQYGGHVKFLLFSQANDHGIKLLSCILAHNRVFLIEPWVPCALNIICF